MSLAKQNLFDLLEYALDAIPVLGSFRRQCAPQAFANSTILREAKVLLFTELATATRCDMPLEQATALSGRRHFPLKDLTGAGSTAREGLSRLLLLFGAVFAVLCLAWCFVFIVSAAFSPVTVILPIAFALVLLGSLRSPRNVARRMAEQLNEHLEDGLTLPQAMRKLRRTYSHLECCLVESGEHWGTMPEALEAVVDANRSGVKRPATGMIYFYPVALLLVALTPILFGQFRVLPKLWDMYEQLGAEIPILTLNMFSILGVFSPYHAIVQLLVGWLLLLLILILLLRVGMNGVVGWIRSYSTLVFFLLLFMIFGVLAGGVMSVLAPMQDLTALATALGLALLSLLLAAALTKPTLGLLELFVRTLERTTGIVISAIPGVGHSIRLNRQSYWLASVALGLRVGVPAPDALRTAGSLVGGRTARQSQLAADLVAAGNSIGSAINRHPVLPGVWNARLARLDASRDYPRALRDLQQEFHLATEGFSARVNAILEVVGIIAIGIVLGLFVIALYLPLFSIPLVVS